MNVSNEIRKDVSITACHKFESFDFYNQLNSIIKKHIKDVLKSGYRRKGNYIITGYKFQKSTKN